MTVTKNGKPLVPATQKTTQVTKALRRLRNKSLYIKILHTSFKKLNFHSNYCLASTDNWNRVGIYLDILWNSYIIKRVNLL